MYIDSSSYIEDLKRYGNLRGGRSRPIAIDEIAAMNLADHLDITPSVAFEIMRGYGPAEVAAILRIPLALVRKQLKSGEIKGWDLASIFRIGRYANWRVRERDLNELLWRRSQDTIRKVLSDSNSRRWAESNLLPGDDREYIVGSVLRAEYEAFCRARRIQPETRQIFNLAVQAVTECIYKVSRIHDGKTRRTFVGVKRDDTIFAGMS